MREHSEGGESRARRSERYRQGSDQVGSGRLGSLGMV